MQEKLNPEKVEEVVSNIEYDRKLSNDRIRILKEQINSGQINVVVRPLHKNQPILNLIKGPGLDDQTYLATAILIKDTQIGEIEPIDYDNPFDLLLFEDKISKDEFEKFKQIAKKLPQLLSQIQPQARGIPIALYRNRKNFRQKKPVITVRENKNGFEWHFDKSALN